MSNKTQRVLIAISAACIAALVIILVVITATGKPEATPRAATAPAVVNPTPSPKLVLDGVWTADDDRFTATIKNSKITILWKLDETSKGLYWAGDFPTAVYEGAAIISTADRSKLDKSIVASQDSTKEFTNQAGKLTFEFGAMGVTKTVVLSKK